VECKKKLIPVITRKTGTISKALRMYQGAMPGKHINYTNTAILGNAHILQEVKR
jgi:hypothetical protein